jgi:hypothetical protein
MRPEVKGYFLKEYGSWSVLIIAFLIGAGVSRAFSWALLPLFLALGLLINSKQAFMKWLRKTSDRNFIFLGQITIVALIFAGSFAAISRGCCCSVIPAAHLLTSKIAGEHFFLLSC